MDPLDRCLDDYEALWRGCRTPPNLLGFVAQLSPAAIELGAAHELALIDIEQRWRFHFHPGLSFVAASAAVDSLPGLPSWADYCRLLPSCSKRWLDGSCREFSVRQLFGDRPDYRDFAKASPTIASELNQRLPALAAELTRATVSLIQKGRVVFSCPLPGRLEVGRCRVGEPAAPAAIDTAGGRRLLIAELTVTHISRCQFRLEVIAKDRLLVQHASDRGYLDCCPGVRLTKDGSCKLPVPCQLGVRDLGLSIDWPAR